VQIEVAEDLEGIEIPPLSLQVLVENAVKHGVSPLEAGGTVRIGAHRDAEFLVIEVDDPGDGKSTFQGTGTAISTLRQRLAEPSDLMWYPIEGGFRFAFRWPLA
jgi:LytS/YehU family sensor histidine kinase